MIEGIFFLLEMVAMLLVVKAVSEEDDSDRPPSLGVFAYQENMTQGQGKPLSTERKSGA